MTKIVCILAVFLTANIAFADLNLVGEKYYVSKDSNIAAYYLDLQQDGSGKIITPHGDSAVTWQQLAPRTAIVTISSDISNVFEKYEVKLVGGAEEYVMLTVTSTLKGLVITEQPDGKMIFDLMNDEVVAEDATLNKSVTDTLLNVEVAVIKPMPNYADQIIALPIDTDDGYPSSAYVGMGQGAGIVLASIDLPYKTFNWTLGINSLKFTLPDGNESTYLLVEEGDLNKVIARYKNATTGRESVEAGFLARDAQIPADQITMASSAGAYKSLLSKIDVTYNFNADGYGGFTSTSEDGTVYDIFWSWKAEDGALKATRYMDPVSFDADLATTKNCAENKAANCIVRQERIYKILSISGNKVVAFRLMKQFKPDGSGQSGSTADLWLFEKQ